METKWVAVCSSVVIVAVILVAMFGPVFLREMSIYSYSQNIPIQIGYDEPTSNWVLSTVVSETEKFKFILDSGTTEELNADETVKTQSEVGLLFEPLRPESKTNLVVTEYTYIACWGVFGVGRQDIKVPMMDVAEGNWLTSGFYEVSVYKDGQELVKQTVEVNYQTQHVIYLETDEGTVTITNMGLIFDGVGVPGGDLITVEDPAGGRQIWNKADFLFMLGKWDSYMQNDIKDPLKVHTWSDVWNFAINRGYLPQEVQMTHVENIDYLGDLDYLRLRYAGICFSANVVCYIPSNLADSIIVNLMAPEPEIVKISPDPLPSVPEGLACIFYVEVVNRGTIGTVDISVQSENYAFTPLTVTSRTMDEMETYTFKFSAYALNVFDSKVTQTDVFVQGRGDTDSYQLEGFVEDVAGYTPPESDPNPPADGGDEEFPWVWIIIILAVVFIVIVVLVWVKVKYDVAMGVLDR